MGKALVIVESPAKARTISNLLGDEFIVESSIGHIRDLPQGAAEVPAAYKGEKWATLGVNVDDGFKPLYVVNSQKKQIVANLKRLLKEADELYLATDEDREGESIAWHLTEVLSPRIPVKRMVFHEITPTAIRRAVGDSRELDRRLVDAQEARRILDRLFGYVVSPVLWKKVMPGTSAGRVQSVATRLVVERERARIAFGSATWWGVDARVLVPGATNPTDPSQPAIFDASLTSLTSTPVASGKDFDSLGTLTNQKARLIDEVSARALSAALDGAELTVSSLTEKPYKRSPAPPFMTSTLQQEAGRKLRFSAKRAMQVAQRLYEEGWITYMRTDSTTLSDEALNAARSQARELYGAHYVPDAPRRYERKVKNAQEAHEAIRPAGEIFRTPEEAARALAGDEYKLYELVWRRTVASQMTDARGTSAQVRLQARVDPSAPHVGSAHAEFSANGRVISFPGFLRAYVEGEDDPEAELAEREVILPPLNEGQLVVAETLTPGTHSTQPPARYTEASLVKAMEELGIGRPSTYASVIATITSRDYVWKKGPALVPSFLAFAVTSLLEQYFPDLVDYSFTASMEDDLDEIASGDEEALPWLSRFYFGRPDDDDVHETTRLGLKGAVESHLGEITAREINTISLGIDSQGREVVVRVGRYGPYLQRGEERTSIAQDTAPDELSLERATELLDAPSGDRILGTDPDTGHPVLVRYGRFGPYIQLGEAIEGGGKPQTASLFKAMEPETVTFEEALRLLTIPRVVGLDPENETEIIAANGRYGPYLKRGTDTRSITDETQLLSITLDEALQIFAQPKVRRGRGQAAPPLRELGADPETTLPVVVKEGRFGPYVTDGTTNASLRRGDEVESVTLERASELLAERRAAGPSTRTKRGAKKSAAKKSAAKRGPAKKSAAKKSASKKAAAKKAGASSESVQPVATPEET